MKILIATDAWHPQVNGVVRTLETTARTLEGKGHSVRFITPNDFKGVPWPFYKEIVLSLASPKKIKAIFAEFQPDCVHIATEGPIGFMVRRHCLKNKISFTTSYHTRFPEYLRKMNRVPERLTYAYLKWFHSKATKTLVPSYTMISELDSRGFRNLTVWNRGVDLKAFKPHIRSNTWPRPCLMYVGRVSYEKNIEAFMALKTTGSKVVVGDGPALDILKAKNPGVIFVGKKTGYDLAWHYSQANVMVFPSKSDTYGLVLLEALACGASVAAYPEPGPLDILAHDESARHCCFVDEDLQVAVDKAIEHGWSMNAVGVAREFTWDKCTDKFLSHLTPQEQSDSSDYQWS